MLLLRVTLTLPVTLGLAFSTQFPEHPACGPPTLKNYGLLGPVKLVRTEELAANGRWEVLERYAFDRAGRLLEDRHKMTVGDSPEHSGYQIFRNVYEPQGRNYQIETFEIDPAQGEKPLDLQHHIVKFDSLNRCIEERDVDGDGELLGKDTYEYDGRGDLVKETEGDSDGTAQFIVDRTYSPDHKLLIEKTFGAGTATEPLQSRRYEYDAHGNQTDMFSYQGGILEAHWISKYDERNRLISVQTIVADPEKDQHVYGRCSDCGLSSGETIYKYDDAGHVVEEQMFEPGNKLVLVQGGAFNADSDRLKSSKNADVYDKHGNWIKSTPPAGTHGRVRYRVIDYY